MAPYTGENTVRYSWGNGVQSDDPMASQQFAPCNIYQYTGALPSTLEVLGLTWKELGWRMFYLNADRRVLSTATATTVLTVIDIFA
jgi:hypothetical protein